MNNVYEQVINILTRYYQLTGQRRNSITEMAQEKIIKPD